MQVQQPKIIENFVEIQDIDDFTFKSVLYLSLIITIVFILFIKIWKLQKRYKIKRETKDKINW